MEGGDVAYASHVGCEVIDLINAFGRPSALLVVAQVRYDEFIGRRLFVFGTLDVDAAHEMSTSDQILDEMMPDEPACARDQDRSVFWHVWISAECCCIRTHPSQRLSKTAAGSDWNEEVTRFRRRQLEAIRGLKVSTGSVDRSARRLALAVHPTRRLRVPTRSAAVRPPAEHDRHCGQRCCFLP